MILIHYYKIEADSCTSEIWQRLTKLGKDGKGKEATAIKLQGGDRLNYDGHNPEGKKKINTRPASQPNTPLVQACLTPCN